MAGLVHHCHQEGHVAPWGPVPSSAQTCPPAWLFLSALGDPGGLDRPRCPRGTSQGPIRGASSLGTTGEEPWKPRRLPLRMPAPPSCWVGWAIRAGGLHVCPRCPGGEGGLGRVEDGDEEMQGQGMTSPPWHAHRGLRVLVTAWGLRGRPVFCSGPGCWAVAHPEPGSCPIGSLSLGMGLELPFLIRSSVTGCLAGPGWALHIPPPFTLEVDSWL